jgi:hypothetical protein
MVDKIGNDFLKKRKAAKAEGIRSSNFITPLGLLIDNRVPKGEKKKQENAHYFLGH